MKKLIISTVTLAALFVGAGSAFADHCYNGRSSYRAPYPNYSRYSPSHVYSRNYGPPHIHTHHYQTRPPQRHYYPTRAYPGHVHPGASFGVRGSNYSFRIGF